MLQNLDSLFPKLPLLEEASSIFGNDIHLKDTLIVGVQHLNETTGSLIEKLIEMGAEAENIFLAGKCYSSNPNSIHKLKILGCSTFTTSLDMEPGAFEIENNKILESLLAVVVARINKTLPGRIIILDDGGRLISSLPEIFYKQRCNV